ncbi:MAG: helix-turn-helix transcriptional regulator [Salinigranum sp.]
MGLSVDDIQVPLAEIKFLARSPNRAVVFDALREGPIERYDIEDVTGVSRATLGRILDDFEARGWVKRTGRRYETTPLGDYVVREFVDLLERFEPVPALNGVARWFPEGGFDFDLGRLAGAEVVRPQMNDALAPTTHIVRRLRTASRIRVLTYTALPGCMEVCWRRTVAGTQEFEGVFDPGTLATLGADPQMTAHAREMLESGRAEVVRYDGDIPTVVVIADDVVLLCLSGGEGAPRAVIETDDETVRAWADSTFESYRSEGRPLDPTLFTG